MVQAESIKARHLPWAVAGAWKSCPEYPFTADRIQGERLTPEEAERLDNSCERCKGTGCIYALPDTVRIVGCHITPGGLSFCEEAGCPGWTPSRDLAVWLNIGARTGKVADVAVNLWTLGIARSEGQRFRAACLGKIGTGFEAIEAVLRAIAQALVAENWNLGEAPDA